MIKGLLDMKKWLPVLLIGALLLGGFVWKKTQVKNDGPVETANPLQVMNEILGKKPIFVEFTSDDCPYCVKMKPIIKELQDKYGEQIQFVIANTGNNEESRKLALFYRVRGIPAVFIHDQEGKIIEKYEGFTTKETLEKGINKVIKP
jgi:thiol-disulfide isomerase/thioredoxin